MLPAGQQKLSDSTASAVGLPNIPATQPGRTAPAPPAAAKPVQRSASLSRHPPISGIRQNHLDRKQSECCQQRPLKQWPIGRKPPQLDLRFLQPIDIIVDTLQFLTIRRAVKFS